MNKQLRKMKLASDLFKNDANDIDYKIQYA